VPVAPLIRSRASAIAEAGEPAPITGSDGPEIVGVVTGGWVSGWTEVGTGIGVSTTSLGGATSTVFSAVPSVGSNEVPGASRSTMPTSREGSSPNPTGACSQWCDQTMTSATAPA
jgi:hypothetical protein